MSGIGRHVEYAQNYVAQLAAQQAREVARESAISADKVQRNTERLYMVSCQSILSQSEEDKAAAEMWWSL